MMPSRQDERARYSAMLRESDAADVDDMRADSAASASYDTRKDEMPSDAASVNTREGARDDDDGQDDDERC